MKKIKLFTDSSVNPQEKIGFGAYLIFNDETELFEDFKDDIKIKRFENTSSTKLELQTLLWALEELKELKEIADKNIVVEVYTDCQNIIGLENRRDKLEKNHFCSSSKKLIANHELYKDFYEKLDSLNLTFIKVKGHKKNSLKDEIDNIFNLVDRASRVALRESMLI